MFVWDKWNTGHIARHDVLPHEAEEVIDGGPFDLEVQIVNGEERVLSIGETKGGRVLLVVAAWDEEQQSTRVVTVFVPSAAQRKQYAQWSGLRDGTATTDTRVQKPRGRGRVVGRESDDS